MTLLITRPVELRFNLDLARKRLNDANMAVGRDDKGAALAIIEVVAGLLFEVHQIVVDGKPDRER
jgi:hypothetical protein